ncbi:MAG: CAP domain-containing protein [Sporomusaceae bacterium]|nr:CAP domain-containing protein [Sporomusaceae bacterium]
MKKFLTESVTKKAGALVLAVSLTVTSLPLGWGGIAFAADTAAAVGKEATDKPSGNKFGGAGALALLGLLALTAGHSDHQPSAGKGSTQATSAAEDTAATTSTTTTTKPSSNITTSTASTGSVQAAEAQAVSLMNADRKANGLAPLAVDSRLTVLGENYAKDMIARNFFAHVNPEGQSPFDRMKAAGITYKAAGENLAINQTIAAAETAFMNSSGHRANILNPNYTNIGIGVAYDGKGDVYVVQEFIGK